MNSKIVKIFIVLFSFFLFNCSAASPEDGKKVTAEIKSYDIIVDAKGTGDFTTVQAAINSAPFLKTTETKIYIKNGIYKEKLELPQNKNNVTFIGESKENVILTYDDYASKKNSAGQDIGTSGSASFMITGNNFKAENITFENSSGPVGQAVAVRIDGDKVIFNNCKFLGFQDTLYPRGNNSRQYYKNCYIEGTTDFIFGASTVIFDQCEIFAKTGGYYITAANTPQANAYGFVFLNCKLTTNSANSTYYLGRPWGNYARTVYVKCEMGSHIKSEGWHNWGRTEAEATTFYGEYQSAGLGGGTASRVGWSHLLTAEQYVADYTMAKIFKDWIPVL